MLILQVESANPEFARVVRDTVLDKLRQGLSIDETDAHLDFSPITPNFYIASDKLAEDLQQKLVDQVVANVQQEMTGQGCISEDSKRAWVSISHRILHPGYESDDLEQLDVGQDTSGLN